jgi:hypothetical protein
MEKQEWIKSGTGTCEKIKKVGNLHSLSIWALVP